MSGGSLNYLCFCESSELFYCKEEIETVEHYLQEKGYNDVAKDCRKLIYTLEASEKEISALSQKLNTIFYIVEWILSGDKIQKDLDEYIRKNYRERSD